MFEYCLNICSTTCTSVQAMSVANANFTCQYRTSFISACRKCHDLPLASGKSTASVASFKTSTMDAELVWRLRKYTCKWMRNDENMSAENKNKQNISTTECAEKFHVVYLSSVWLSSTTTAAISTDFWPPP